MLYWNVIVLYEMTLDTWRIDAESKCPGPSHVFGNSGLKKEESYFSDQWKSPKYNFFSTDIQILPCGIIYKWTKQIIVA